MPRSVTCIQPVVSTISILFVAITARMITAMALTSAVPDMQDRGAFMSVNASLQQFSGGIASSVAGIIVVQRAGGDLVHYDLLGYVVVAAVGATIALMYPIHKAVMAKTAATAVPPPAPTDLDAPVTAQEECAAPPA